jgi:hypothetical protein
VRDFIEFARYSEKEFWKIVDGFYSPEIFDKDDFGAWKLREPAKAL